VGEWITSQETLTSWSNNNFGQAKEAEEAVESLSTCNFWRYGWKRSWRPLLSRLHGQSEARVTGVKDHPPVGIGISPYTKILSGEESFADILDDEIQDKMKGVILGLDAGLEELSAYSSVMLGQDVEKLVVMSATNFQMLESKLLVSAQSMGGRSEELASELDFPTIWGVLAAINLRVEEVRAEANRYVNSAPQRADPLLGVRVPVKRESDLLATVTHLSEAIRGLGSRLDDQLPGPAPLFFPARIQTYDRLDNSFALDLQERVNNSLSGQIENLRGEKQVGSIKFAGLGFDSAQKASAGLTINIATVDWSAASPVEIPISNNRSPTMFHAAEDKLQHGLRSDRSTLRRTELGFVMDYSPRPFVSIPEQFPFWLLGLEPAMVSTLHFYGVQNAEALRTLATINGAPTPLITNAVIHVGLSKIRFDSIGGSDNVRLVSGSLDFLHQFVS
jgi:hypothetical protein